MRPAVFMDRDVVDDFSAAVNVILQRGQMAQAHNLPGLAAGQVR